MDCRECSPRFWLSWVQPGPLRRSLPWRPDRCRARSSFVCRTGTFVRKWRSRSGRSTGARRRPLRCCGTNATEKETRLRVNFVCQLTVLNTLNVCKCFRCEYVLRLRVVGLAKRLFDYDSCKWWWQLILYLRNFRFPLHMLRVCNDVFLD